MNAVSRWADLLVGFGEPFPEPVPRRGVEELSVLVRVNAVVEVDPHAPVAREEHKADARGAELFRRRARLGERAKVG